MRNPHRGTLLIGTFLTASLLALSPEPALTQQENSDSEQTSARDREIPREQDAGAPTDGAKGDVTQTEQAAEADKKVQSPAEQDVGKNEDRKSDQVTTEAKEETNRDGEIAESAGGGTKARADVSPRKRKTAKTGKPSKTAQNVAKNPWGKLSQNVQPKFECPWQEIPVWQLFCPDIRASTLTFGESVATAIATTAPNQGLGTSHPSIHGILGKTGGPGNTSAYGGAAGSAAADAASAASGAAGAAAGAAGAAGAAAAGAAGAAAGAAGAAAGAAGGAAAGAAGAAAGAAGAAAGAAGAAAGAAGL